jgi:hypothetical protein
MKANLKRDLEYQKVKKLLSSKNKNAIKIGDIANREKLT